MKKFNQGIAVNMLNGNTRGKWGFHMTFEKKTAVKLLKITVSSIALAACSITPEPFTRSEVMDMAISDRNLIENSQVPIENALSLSEATARALKFNLEHRVQVMSQALSSESFQLAKLDMLPILTLEGGVQARDEFNASSSESLRTRLESLEPSFSEDRSNFNASARFSWNILDFGVSYLRAKQEADRFIIARMARQKSAQTLALQVRVAFWRSAALQLVSVDVDRLLGVAAKARKNLELVGEQQLRPPVDTLEDIRNLSEIIQQLETLRETANAADVDLASLINVVPGEKIRLNVSEELYDLPDIDGDMGELELIALTNSADYSTEIYNARITQREVRKSLLRLLPGAELFAGSNYDTNSFLAFNQWNQVGARVNWNIFRLLAAGQISDHNDAQILLVEARKLAANMGVVTQLHAAKAGYESSKVRLNRAADIDDIDEKIQTLTDQAEQSRATSEIVQLRVELRSLRSKVARMLAYAGAQQAWGALLNSLSLSPVPDNYQTYSVDDLAYIIERSYSEWRGGRLPKPTDEPAGLVDAAAD